MLILQESEICPYRFRCPHNDQNQCFGAEPKRTVNFTCIFVSGNGHIDEKQYRNPLDKTGKMKIIME